MTLYEKLADQDLDAISGGASGYEGVWVTVRNLETGYLAMRTQPTYDYSNEIRGSESYNGQPLQIAGGFTNGGDGKLYVWVYNPRSGRYGWANAAYLG